MAHQFGAAPWQPISEVDLHIPPTMGAPAAKKQALVWVAAIGLAMGAFGAALWGAGIISLIFAVAPAPVDAGEACPVSYSGSSKAPLFGGVIESNCRTSNGQACQRNAKW